MIAVLAGGTGGAKLARGLADAVGPRELSVIANTGDDVEVYGVHVSPDPDLVTYWLAGVIDERGWGIRGDSWEVMSALEAASHPAWFRLGDRDLAMCLVRTEQLRAGKRPTAAQQAVARGLGVESAVLPMADEQVRTHVRAGGRWQPFQEFMIAGRAEGPVEGVELRGIERTRPTPEVLGALRAAEAIVVGPSNPVISIGPILAVPGMREAIAAARAPVVAVSPFVGGRAIKGPTEAFCAWAGLPLGAGAALSAYAGLIDGLVCDEEPGTVLPRGDARPAVRRADTLMDGAPGRRRVAEAVLALAESLRAGAGETAR